MSSRSRYDTGPRAVVLAPAAATLIVYVPELATDAGQMADLPTLARWVQMVLLLGAAPVVASAVALRTRAGVDRRAAAAAGLAQLAVAVGLVRLDVWIEVRTGYLLAGSGEEAMAYGLSTIAGIAGGLVLAVLVVLAIYIGTRAAAARESRSSAWTV